MIIYCYYAQDKSLIILKLNITFLRYKYLEIQVKYYKIPRDGLNINSIKICIKCRALRYIIFYDLSRTDTGAESISPNLQLSAEGILPIDD